MPKRGYHHGNLRAALVEAALDLIAERGPAGFSMAEAAKAADVSAAAPYRHFDNREALLIEVAVQGYAIFCDLMDYAWDEGRPSPMAAFSAMGRAYLVFAERHPGHYMAMFEAGLSVNATPELAAAAERANGVLTRAAAALARDIPPERRPPAAMFSAHIWAMSHGIVALFARGGPGARSPLPAEALLESGIGVYLRGLGLIPPDC